MTKSKRAGARQSSKTEIGVGRAPATRSKGGKQAVAGSSSKKPSATNKIPTSAAKAPVGSTKLATLISMMSATSGASIEELCAATGWQAHSVRGAIAGALKNKGYEIASNKHDGVRRYCVQGDA